MTETRKKICDIIGVKTIVSEMGILNGEKVRILNNVQYVDTQGIVRSSVGVDTKVTYDYYRSVDYDITAVLKYIENMGGFISLNEGRIQVMYMNLVIGYLEIKPLPLYIEKEEEELLELLIKLR